MSELVLMRQRIKAVDTIKKITHAMCLVSMSTHSRLRAKKAVLEHYITTLSSLYTKVQRNMPLKLPHSLNNPVSRTLHILVGSQKGLCGNFNTNLYTFYKNNARQDDALSLDVITIGKKMSNYTIHLKKQPLTQFNEFNSTTLTSLAKSLSTLIMTAQPSYDSAIIYSNYPKTFFIQKSHQTILMPTPTTVYSEAYNHEPYLWEQEPSLIIKTITDELLYTTIKTVLLQSLIAEQAARFISMDSSTRNANTLITHMRLEYNKLRQTKITRELTDLAGNF